LGFELFRELALDSCEHIDSETIRVAERESKTGTFANVLNPKRFYEKWSLTLRLGRDSLSPMNTMQELRRRLKAILPSLLGLCMCAYFGYHAIQGDRGVIRLMHLKQELKQAEESFNAVHTERLAWDAHVAGLKPGSLDPDLIEERARVELGMGKKGERVIFLNGAN
jgi:cell division protein FtsB